MQLPYFYEPLITSEKSQYILSEDSSKHAVQVLRMKEGEQLQLTDGKGLLVTAEIKNAHKKNTIVEILSSEIFPYPHKDVCLAVSPTKNSSRIEWLAEKVTEVGIKKIILLKTKRTEKTHINLDRLHNILVSAMLQSRRVYLPELTDLIIFDNVIKNNTYAEKYIAHCVGNGDKIDLKEIKSSASKIILIGPEGDFTDEEINSALAENFKPVSLGNTRLRTETAGLAAAILLIF